jgi:hypothetical protein
VAGAGRGAADEEGGGRGEGVGTGWREGRREALVVTVQADAAVTWWRVV